MSSRDVTVAGCRTRPRSGDRTELTRVEHLPHLRDVRVVAPVVRLHHHHVGCSRRVGDPLGRRRRSRRTASRRARACRPRSRRSPTPGAARPASRCRRRRPRRTRRARVRPERSVHPTVGGGLVPGRDRGPRRRRARPRRPRPAARSPPARRCGTRRGLRDGWSWTPERLYRCKRFRPTPYAAHRDCPSPRRGRCGSPTWIPDLRAALRGLYGDRPTTCATAREAGARGSGTHRPPSWWPATASGGVHPTGTSQRAGRVHGLRSTASRRHARGSAGPHPAPRRARHRRAPPAVAAAPSRTARATAATRSATTSPPTLGSAPPTDLRD
jgi:hypothetical protein